MEDADKIIIKRILTRINEAREVADLAAQIQPRLIRLTLENELSERDFYRISSVLSPQSRSPLWEKYFIQKHQCNRVKVSDDAGDFEKNGVFYEYKASGYNRDNAMHIVQIRLWQKCNYVVQSISDDAVYTFILKHKEMKRETKLCKAAVAHGTKTSNADNKNIELRITVAKKSPDWARWLKQYSHRTL